MNFLPGHRSHSVTLLADSDLALDVVGLTGAEIVDKRSVDVADEFVGLKKPSIGDAYDEKVGRLLSDGAVYVGLAGDGNIMGLL